MDWMKTWGEMHIVARTLKMAEQKSLFGTDCQKQILAMQGGADEIEKLAEAWEDGGEGQNESKDKTKAKAAAKAFNTAKDKIQDYIRQYDKEESSLEAAASDEAKWKKLQAGVLKFLTEFNATLKISKGHYATLKPLLGL